MESSAQDRLNLAYAAWNTAFQRRAADIKPPATDEEAEAVLANIAWLEQAYLRAAQQALDETGPEIESAYQAARDAKRKVDDAYAAARSLAERISLVADLAGKVGTLVTKASGGRTAPG